MCFIIVTMINVSIIQRIHLSPIKENQYQSHQSGTYNDNDGDDDDDNVSDDDDEVV